MLNWRQLKKENKLNIGRSPAVATDVSTIPSLNGGSDRPPPKNRLKAKKNSHTHPTRSKDWTIKLTLASRRQENDSEQNPGQQLSTKKKRRQLVMMRQAMARPAATRHYLRIV